MLATRFKSLGFQNAFATTSRRSVLKLAQAIGAVNITEEENFYFDGKNRWVIEAAADSLPKLTRFLARW